MQTPQAVPPKAKEINTQPKGVITPPVFPRTQNGLDLNIDVDFLWWKSEVSGTFSGPINNKAKTPPSDFKAGFKVGVGLDLGFDGWDGYAEYTYFNQPTITSSFKAKHPAPSSLIRVDSDGFLYAPLLRKGYVSREEQFNALDVELGRNFFISRRLTLRPNFGFKGARIFETLDLQANSKHYHFKQTLSGLGIRAGLDTVWHLTKSFGLYGDAAVTGLWSSIHNSNNSFESHTQTILPVLELGVGLSYQAWFADQSYQLYAKAGWEEQIWINYNQISLSPSPASGSLTLQGLTLKVGFAF